MSKKYISREAPVPGSSVSETHPGYWADRIKYENHRRENWMNEYGRFYYQHPSACYCTEELRYPLDTYQPPMTQIDNYLGAGTVSRSQPIAYLRACMAEKDRRDGSVHKNNSGNTKSRCAVCNDMGSVQNKNVPRDQGTKAYEQSPGGFGKEHGIPTFIPCVVHTPCGSAQIGICETRPLKSTECYEIYNRCGNDTCTGKEDCAKHPRDSYLFPPTLDCCADFDRVAFRKDASMQSQVQRRVQKICGPQESSASRCPPWPIKPRSAALDVDILCTPRACCGSPGGRRGQLADCVYRNSASKTLAPFKECDVTSLPFCRKPCDPKSTDGSLSCNSAVVQQGYQQLPFGKLLKRAN